MLPSIFGENLFDDFFGDSFEKEFFGNRNPVFGKHGKNMMKTDVKELEDCYELDVDLPGFQKDEVNVSVQDGYLTIQASKNLDRDNSDKKGRYIRQERFSGSCSRSFYVGDAAAQYHPCQIRRWHPAAERTQGRPQDAAQPQPH